MKKKEKQKEKAPPGYFRGYKREIDNAPKKEAEVQYESASDRKKYNSSNLVVVVAMAAVVVTSAVLLWVLYSVIHVSHLSELAGIHLTENFQKTASEIINKGEGDYAPAGYEGWQTYKDELWEFKYPADWQFSQNDGMISLKKYNQKQYNYFDSLALVMEISHLDNPENLDLAKYLAKNEFPTGEKIQTEIGGKKAWRTGVFKNEQGLIKRNIYWLLEGGRIIKLETTFYNSDYEALFGDFEKMILSIRFL